VKVGDFERLVRIEMGTVMRSKQTGSRFASIAIATLLPVLAYAEMSAEQLEEEGD